MISFGPVPSRRLGKSLGINNIPSRKRCSYSCRYCQVGVTKNCSISRETFYQPKVLFDEVTRHLQQLSDNDKPDYLCFVSNGEPTLDKNIGKSIDLLKTLGIPVAVITNASLMSLKNVRDDLAKADWVSVKIDAYHENTWKSLNKPHGELNFREIMQGVTVFSRNFTSTLATETMLVKDANDCDAILNDTAGFIADLHAGVSYLSIPTRPPADTTVMVPDEATINNAFQIFNTCKINTELLLGFEGTNMGYTGNVIDDILNICAVHPIRDDSMEVLLEKEGKDFRVVDEMIYNGLISKVYYNSKAYYVRKFNV